MRLKRLKAHVLSLILTRLMLKTLIKNLNANCVLTFCQIRLLLLAAVDLHVCSVLLILLWLLTSVASVGPIWI